MEVNVLEAMISWFSPITPIALMGGGIFMRGGKQEHEEENVHVKVACKHHVHYLFVCLFIFIITAEGEKASFSSFLLSFALLPKEQSPFISFYFELTRVNGENGSCLS